MLVAGAAPEVLLSGHVGLVPAAHPAASEEYWCSLSDSVRERPLRRSALRASGRSSKIDCQLPYIQATLCCRKQNSRNLFRRIWSTKEPVYPRLWVLTKLQSACYSLWVSLLTCVSHHQSTVCISVYLRFSAASLLKDRWGAKMRCSV